MPASFDIKTGQGNYEKRKLQANLTQNTDVKLMGKIFENRTSQCYIAIRAPQSRGLFILEPEPELSSHHGGADLPPHGTGAGRTGSPLKK